MDCRPFGEESLEQFLQRHRGRRRTPYGGGLELTARCNLRCRHCYCGPAGKELAAADWSRIIGEMAAAGVLGVYLTGGEPLLRPDFPEIYAQLRRRGLLVTLFTNGTLLEGEALKVLCRYPPYYVEVSLYGASHETYEKVTGSRDYFEACLAGIERLRQNGLRYLLKTVLLQDNEKDFPELQRLAREQGVPLRYDGAITPSLDPGRSAGEGRLPPERIVAAEAADPPRRAAWDRFIGEKLGVYEGQRLLRCGAGTTTFFITAPGEMLPCLMLRNLCFDLRRGSFAAGLSRLRQVESWRRRAGHPCSRCAYGVICEQCPGWSLWVHRDLETPVDFLCQAAHLRVKRFGVGR